MSNSEVVRGPKFNGRVVFMDGQEYVVPALSVRDFRDNFKKLTANIGAVNPENFLELLDQYVPVIGLAVRRNYPELTDDKLIDMVDLDSFPQIIKAIAASSGMQAAKPGE